MANLQQLEIDFSPEIWKDIPGYEGYYQVSNYGRIKSVARVVQHRSYPRTVFEKIRTPICSKKTGYLTLQLHNIQTNKPVCLFVHRLVCQAFVEGYFEGACVNHKDGNKQNNHTSNLEWVTYRQNMHHAKKTGLTAKGSKNCKAKIGELQVLEIRKLFNEGLSRELIAAQFNLSQGNTNKIIGKRLWKHI